MSNLMNLTIVFGVFILVALLWHQIFRISPEEGMVLSAASVMLVVFLAGLAGNTFFSYYILGILGAAGLITFLLNISLGGKRKGSVVERVRIFVSPCVAAMAVLFIYSVVAFKGAMYTYPDELYQWGPAVRHMARSGHLPYGNGFSGSDVTLSMATMFQYFWVGLTEFVERNSFIGNFLLAFIPAYLPFGGISWKNWKKIGLYTGILFFGFNAVTYVKYYTVLQDFVLPMWAGGIIAWLLWSNKKQINWGVLLGSLMCISAMKSMVGPLFAGMIILLVAVRQWIYYRPGKMKEILNVPNLVLAAASIVSMICINKTWAGIIGQSVNNRFIAYDPVNKSVEEIAKKIINKVFLVFSGENKALPYMSFFIMFMMVLVFLALLWNGFSDQNGKMMFRISFSLYALGFPLFLFLMLFAYMRVFGANDAQSVAGLERYLAYYMLLGCVPMISSLFMQKRMKNNRCMNAVPVVLLVLLVFGTGNDFVCRISSVNQEEDAAFVTREETREQADKIIELAEKPGKILILGNVSVEISKMLDYELEGKWNHLCYRSFARESESSTLNCDVVRYPDLLKNMEFDYLWCYQSGKDMDTYFDIIYRYNLNNFKEGALYKVEYSMDGAEVVYLGNTLDDGAEED